MGGGPETTVEPIGESMTNSPIRCPEGRLGVRYVDGETTRVAPYCFECSLLKPEQRCAEVRPQNLADEPSPAAFESEVVLTSS